MSHRTRLRVLFSVFASAGLCGTASAAPPPAPTVPPALEPAVKAARQVVSKLREHCAQSRSRNGEWFIDEEYYDKRCPTWIEQLTRPDEAVIHALGQTALAPSFSSSDWDTAMGDWPGLVANVGEVGGTIAVQYLVRAASHLASRDEEEAMLVVVDALRTATGTDAARLPPWPIDEDTRTGVRTGASAVAAAWVEWFSAHGQQTPEQWRAAGLAASRAELASTDPIVRFTAIERQLGPGGDSAAALEALEEALSHPLVSAGFVDAAARLTPIVTPALLDRAARARDEAVATLPAGAEVAMASAASEGAEVKRLLRDCTRAFESLRLDEAMRACATAAKLDPKSVRAVVDRGWVELEVGDTARARASAEAALAMKPGAVSAAQLAAAVATVDGELGRARTILESAAKSSVDARQRLTILSGQPPKASWLRYIGPRHACWAKRGPKPAAAFLLRRGFPDPKTFEAEWSSLPAKERKRLEKAGLRGCPL